MPKKMRVSVILPAYYSDRTIALSLNSLRSQTFRDFEVIVVNSSPEERTRQLVSEEFPEVRFYQSPNRLLPHAARNKGVSLSHGEILVFTDPDCQCAPDWLAKLIAAHGAGHPVVGGSMGLTSDLWFENGVHLSKFHWLLRGLPQAPRWILPTANVSYTRNVLNITGPFDGTIFGGDALQSWRVAAAGYQPWFEPQAVVKHHHGGTTASFWRERRSRGEEFANVRVQFEDWPLWRLVSYILFFPLLPLLVLIRAGGDAAKSGWTGRYLATIPLQLVGHLGWALGETRAYTKIVSGKLMKWFSG